MIECEVEIINKLGLHARAATKLVKLASGFKSGIRIGRGDQASVDSDEDKTVDGKSIMGVMMLAASQGTVIRLVIEGSDEQVAADQIAALIADCFGEGE